MHAHSVNSAAEEERARLLRGSGEMASSNRDRLAQSVYHGGADCAEPSRHDMVFTRHPDAIIISQLPSHVARSSEPSTMGRSKSLRYSSTFDMPRNRAGTRVRRRHTFLLPSQTPVSMSQDAVDGSASEVDSVDEEALDEMNDEELWKRRKTVKYMATNLTVKRKYRDRVMSHQNKSGTGLYTLKRKSFYKLRLQAKEVAGRLEFWAKSLKVIEGHFGSAILSYFTFVRWLMFLNLFIGMLLFLVITLPYLVLQPNQTFQEYADAIAVTDDVFLNQSVKCSEKYLNYLNDTVSKHNATDYVLDFLQGTGFMENTVLFYGNYFNKTLAGFDPAHLVQDPWSMVYNMSLAYLLATGVYFIVSFILIIRHSAAGLKEGVLSQETSSTKYCNKVLTGWDFCITDGSKAMLKHRNLRKELEADLFEQQMERERAARRKRDWIKLYVIRIFINICVVSVLGAALALIYLTNDWSLMLQKNDAITEQILKLLVQFLPSITITILNIIVPVFFGILVRPEGYSPGFEIKITLARTVLLRLASVLILMISLYDQVVATTSLRDKVRQGTTAALEAIGGDNSSQAEPQVDLNITSSSSECGNKNFNQVRCWETYVGQQLYKLVLLDLIVVLLVTFFVEFPRKLLHRKFHSKFRLISWLGKQQFDIPQNVLDIVYCQTLCWLGAFFSPLIPFISMLKCFIFFYVKKLTLLQNCDPPEKPFHTSRSNSFFMTVLLISFIMASIPIGYIVGRIPPSQSCGPFRVYSEPEYYMFHSLTNLIQTFSDTTRDFFYFFGSVAFYVPAIILLCLLMYYFWAVGQGYKKMGELLKTQLAMEGKDKQYLLMRVTEAFKRG
ncbi:transmembrane channel-like protein 7 isoform X2 [Liolophura sinensis]|uniref:transmembrane channel-like protein 7 isoform X2 n=2 Tax=Liolophura sinensis TaxID=3198878 RepID=UPI0031590A44